MSTIRRIAGNDLVLLGLRILFGSMFVYAGALKIADPMQFAFDIRNYDFLPVGLINLWAITLPWVELLAGALLIAGLWSRAASSLVALMFLSFVVALTAALARGLDIDCGCFSGEVETGVTLLKVLSDLGMMALTAPIIAYGAGRFSLAGLRSGLRR